MPNVPVESSRAADARVMSLVGFAHAVSHFSQLVVPSLFPWIMADFGLSFTGAGALTTTFFVVSSIGQALAGFAVDRWGARVALWTGLGSFTLAALVLASASGYPMLLVAAVLGGAGNAVFHPADFTLLNRRVSPARLGHAFSVHSLSGNLGWAVAPVLVTGTAALAGWRAAALVAAAVAAAALVACVALREILADARPAAERAPARGEPRASPFAFLGVGTIWMCFLFFLASTMGFGALQNFGPLVLKNLYGLSLAAGASSLTVYLLGSAAGVVFGGFLAARHRAHERIVAILLGTAALAALLLSTAEIPGAAVAPVMAFVGFCTGSATPSRDLLVRNAAMQRFGQQSFGRVYGFVYSGLDVGLSAAPIAFGRLMDRGLFGAVLLGVAAFQSLAVLAALRVGAAPRPAPAARGADAAT